MAQIPFIWNICLTFKGGYGTIPLTKTTPPSVSGKELGYETADPETAKNLRLYLGFHRRARISPFGAGDRRRCGPEVPLYRPLPSQRAGKTRAISLPGVSPRPVAEETDPHANQIPVVGNVAAGSPILAEECIEDYLTFDTEGLSGEHFALRVRGESMLGAGILPGDLVVVHRQAEAQSGQIVVALFEDEATVKTLRRRDGKVWLMPANDDYQPIDGTKAQILGQVVAVVRRY